MKFMTTVSAILLLATLAQAEYACRCNIGRAGGWVHFTGATEERAYANALAYCGHQNQIDCGHVVPQYVHTSPDLEEGKAGPTTPGRK